MRAITRHVRTVLSAIGLPVAIALLVRATLVQAYHIPSGSMEDTLFPGDFVLAEKLTYGPWVPGRVPGVSAALPSMRIPGLREVRPGDVVIFESPRDPGVDLVKRCVAVAGQTVEMRNKRLYVDGRPFGDPATSKTVDPRALVPRDQFGPFVVPEGYFFAMGDNRDASFDSRFFGAVPLVNVRAHPVAIYFSWNRAGQALGKIRWRHLGGVR